MYYLYFEVINYFSKALSSYFQKHCFKLPCLLFINWVVRQFQYRATSLLFNLKTITLKTILSRKFMFYTLTYFSLLKLQKPQNFYWISCWVVYLHTVLENKNIFTHSFFLLLFAAAGSIFYELDLHFSLQHLLWVCFCVCLCICVYVRVQNLSILYIFSISRLIDCFECIFTLD
jgi:hypothetical protein